MRVTHYIFPDNVPEGEMIELAIKYNLEITLDVPKDVVKQRLYDKGYLESIEQEVPEDWLVFSVMGSSKSVRELLDQYPVKAIAKEVEFLKVAEIKKLLKKYGGDAYSEFYHRGTGEFYGCTPIELTGNNQKVGYKVKA